jgi:diaminohydroxyphosphoribosylaminopyrimidine deaminase/5-amino-6-(5-phosphoribosylamino)uracil reductase
VNALAQAGAAAQGATAYVTLMPCDHTGKTPPCTQALIRAGVTRVVAAIDDPNPVSGDGRATLAGAGIRVETGLLAAEAAQGACGFLKHLATGLPFLQLKYAMTLDGKTATHRGDSQWVSSDAARVEVQAWRAQADAVMVGIGTALADDPRLTVRDEALPQPRRVVVDSGCRLSPEARLCQEGQGEVIVLTTERPPADRVLALESAGVTVVRLGAVTEHVDLAAGLQALAAIGIRTILCEGGATLAGSLLDE